ncbi:hypothetical protein Tco_1447219 [Tanacetum coccineum]
MIAYLEKTEGNVEFHEVIDFLRRSYIYHALTVSPVVSTTFVEQFWTSAKSKTINNVRHITAKDTYRIIFFDSIQLMGYEGDLTVLTFNKALFSPQWRRANITSGKVTPLFDTMLVQPTQDEGASSERLSDEQPSPSPAPTSEVPNESLPDSTFAQPSEVSDQAKEIKLLKAKINKLKKQAKPVIKHHKAYLKTVSLQHRFPRKSFSKKYRMHKESVSKQGRKIAKGESSVLNEILYLMECLK